MAKHKQKAELMPAIHVCALSKIQATAQAIGARSLVTLINFKTMVQRPDAIAAERHLFLAMSDIVSPQDGHILPDAEHVTALLAFAKAWDRREPLLIHCFAGVSRSTAAAFIFACALEPARAESSIAAQIRSLSPTATPNARLVAVADAQLGRDGRMSAAIQDIGRGEDCFEGVPFALAVPVHAA